MLPRPRQLLVASTALVALGVGGAGALSASAPAESPTLASTVPADGGATPADGVGDAVAKSEAEPFRMEVFLEVAGMGAGTGPAVSVMTGEFADGRTHVVADLSAALTGIGEAAELPPGLSAADLSLELITDGTDLYVRAPILDLIAEQSGGAAGPLGPFTTLGDGWGYVDLAAAADMSPGGLTEAMGVTSVDPSAVFNALAELEGAEAIGTEQIRGVSATGVRAEASLVDLLVAQGLDPAELDVAGMEDLAGVTIPVEVWIDKDGLVRRLVIDIDSETFADVADATDQPLDPASLGAVELSVTIELFDYSASDIVIEAPTEFIDVTDALVDLMATTAALPASPITTSLPTPTTLGLRS